MSTPSEDRTIQSVPNPGELRILVVDDNIDNRRIMQAMLMKITAVVEFKQNGQEGVDAVFHARAIGHDFDLILLDMLMPVMDGYTAATKIREAGISTPIVAVTALAMADDRAKCLNAGCDDYLTKPLIARDFYLVVGSWLFRVPPDAPEALATDLTSNPVMAELAEDFRQSLPERLKEIRSALAADDVSMIRVLAHRLRGTAANLGMPQVSYAAGLTEDAFAQSPSSNEARHAITRLLSTLEYVIRHR